MKPASHHKIVDSGPRQSDRVLKVQQQQQQHATSPQHKNPPRSNLKPKPVTEEEEVIVWPIYQPQAVTKMNEKFWDRKVPKSVIKSSIRFQGVMLRLGKKKKTPKGYFYRLFADGTLQYFKKEGDQSPKGQIQMLFVHVAHLNEQKTKKDSLLVVQIEKFEGLHITLFDHKSQLTLQFFSVLKDFCVVSGFDKLYTQMEILGKGSFASVYKVKSIHSDAMYAAKTYFKETFESSQHKNKFVLMIKNEIMALRKVIHPGVIRLYEIIQEKERLILVMELVNGGDLYQLIKETKKIPEKSAAHMLKGAAEALNEMHQNGFVHRDLKLENIMLKAKDSWDIKLVDFGFAEPINEKELVSKAGTPGYIPPEIFKLNPYTSKGDVFSLGVIFYSLVSGISAFKGRNYQAVLEENRKCEINYERSVWKDISGDFKSLLKKMLAPKPQQRISCAEILDHDWIIDHTCPEKRQYSNSMLLQKQMTKQRSLYNHSDGSDQDFACEFSYHTNDLKSFYQRMNSQKTFRTQKSNMSGHSKMKQSQNMRSQSAAKQQFVSMKSQTMKASIHQNKTVQRHGSDGKQASPNPYAKGKSGYKSEQASFGEVLDNDSIAEDGLTVFTMFDDLSIPMHNLTFLKTAFQTFNRNKKPQRK